MEAALLFAMKKALVYIYPVPNKVTAIDEGNIKEYLARKYGTISTFTAATRPRRGRILRVELLLHKGMSMDGIKDDMIEMVEKTNRMRAIKLFFGESEEALVHKLTTDRRIREEQDYENEDMEEFKLAQKEIENIQHLLAMKTNEDYCPLDDSSDVIVLKVEIREKDADGPKHSKLMKPY